MSLVIISMMTIVALGVVFADKEGCSCNKGCVPKPPENIKESGVDSENTEGNVQPLNTCMRTWIEYRNCSPKQWTWKVHKCVLVRGDWGGVTAHVICKGTWTQQCDKYRVWYNNCTHEVMYKEYLGRVTRSGTVYPDHWGDCNCP